MVTLIQPSPLAASAVTLQAPACGNALLGIVKANVTGGDPPYGITWNNGNKGDTAFNLLEGEVEFTVTDQSRSQVSVRINLLQAAEPMAISLTPTVYPNGRNTSCYTCTNGIIQTNITGGLAPLTYNWQPIGATTANISNLSAGHYTLTVTDNSGCIATSDVYLTNADRDDWSMNGSNIDPITQFLGSTNNADVIFKRNNLESLRLGNSGKVGIGVADPQYGLDVNGTARFSQGVKLPQLPQETNPIQSGGTLKVLGLDQYDNITAYPFDMGMLFSSLTPICGISDPVTGFYTPFWRSVTGQQPKIHVGAAECPPFVGIATENPRTNLDVNGNTFTSKLQIGGNSIADFENNSNSLIVKGNSTFNLTNDEAFIINQTETAGYQFLMSLNANNANAKIIGVQNGPATNAVNTFNLYADGRMELGENGTNAGILLKVNGGVVFGNENDPTNVFTIYGNGKVGIGGVPGGETKLAVEGLITARLLKLRPPGIAFSDYVFDKNYKLLSLSETESYLKQHKHLPGIPTAREVEQDNGFEVGSLQLKSLEKIEELYLHIIALEKRIKELESVKNATKN